MTDILKILGDDWHNDHPYLGLIEKVLPGYPYAQKVEQKLVEVYVEQQNNFKLYKNTTGETTYDYEINCMMSKKKKLEDEKEKEEKRFNKLLDKFKEQAAAERSSGDEKGQEEEEEDEEEEEEEEEEVVKHKGKGQLACRRTLKKEEETKKALVKNLKSSMASSQAKLMEIGEEIDKLDKMCEYYTHYRNASRNYILASKKLILEYSQTKDLETLIRSLADVIAHYEKMMRYFVPSEPCQGHEKGLCETHLLPLYLTVFPNQGFKHVWKCVVSP